MQAYLILANGRVFRGVSVGCPGTTIGEVVFATGMVGFEETLTDPSYYGQIITQTYPLIGNYGMNSEDVESTKIWARGYIVREACKTPSNFRSEETLDAFLKKNGIIGIEGIDTRSLTRTLRESGVMNGAITTEFDPDAEPEKKAALLPEIAAYAVVDAVKAVTCREAVTYEPTAAGAWGDTPLHVALLDLGCKNNIVRCLQKRGCRVTVLPGTATAAQIGLMDRLHQGDYQLIDRDTGKTPEEKQALMRQALTCGTFIMSSNAISADGQLVNIDGNANRVAALCFGPESVLVIAGMNKVMGDLDSAIARARQVAAPANAQRFDIKTPCAVTGSCGDCTSSDCICCQMVITRACRPAGRIKVILVGEDLGF